MAKDNLKMRLEVERRIYEDSPNVTATYKDLARINEILIQLIDGDNKIGFGVTKE